MLYTMELTGEEIEKYLEFSYSGWLNSMKSSGDYLLEYRLGGDGKPALTDNQLWLKNQPYNFDSAAGLEYIVDASKPDGQKVEILCFTDGRKFRYDATYRVAVNSYRGNGGGGHFAEGAGIKNDDLMTRVVASTERDLRYYIMKYIEEKKNIYPEPLNNWKIIPEQWVKSSASRERALLFGQRN
jgi:2',3'-cyclic-nucleotide 2'-phosphodiesterase/3'-nucleotidase